MLSKIKVFLEMIKFEHTIFALPFAYLGAFLGARYLGNSPWPSWSQLFWVTLAMIGARTSAMALNRLIDRRIDAKNPRTAQRAIPKGLLSVGEVIVYIILSLALMGFAALKLNILCFELMPVAVFFLTIYSYTKRFTWACHLILGITDALAPMGGWIAVTGAFNLPGVLLSLAVAVWVGGFDMIYACQDVEFEKKHGVHSVPVRFGVTNALKASSVFHVITVILFALTGILLGRGLLFFCGVLAAAFLLYQQHRMVSPHDLSRLGFAFFNLNSYVSIILFSFALADLVWKVRIL